MPSLHKYVALLRGINVGGHKKVPMADLRELYASLGFEEVRTLLNSGNVIFAGKKIAEKQLVKKIETTFQERFGFESRTMVRSEREITALVDSDPFKRIKAGKDTRLFVSFLRERPEGRVALPYTSPKKDFKVMRNDGREVFSVLLVPSMRAIDSMAWLDRTFGDDLTTRNWNTVQKIASAMQG